MRYKTAMINTRRNTIITPHVTIIRKQLLIGPASRRDGMTKFQLVRKIYVYYPASHVPRVQSMFQIYTINVAVCKEYTQTPTGIGNNTEIPETRS